MLHHGQYVKTKVEKGQHESESSKLIKNVNTVADEMVKKSLISLNMTRFYYKLLERYLGHFKYQHVDLAI